MGLIKTGLTLAGGYGLIKAASKAANDYEDRKQRQSQSQTHFYPHQQYQPGYEPQMSYMYSNPTKNAPFQPGWHSPYESQPVYGGQMGHAAAQTQNRVSEPQAGRVQHLDRVPSSNSGHASGMSGSIHQRVGADEYYSEKPF